MLATGWGNRGMYGITIWNTKNGEVIHTFGHPVNVAILAFSPDGGTLAVSGCGGIGDNLAGFVHFYDATTWKLRGQFSYPFGGTYICFSPKGKMLARGAGPKDRELTIVLHDTANGKELRRMKADKGFGFVVSLEFCPKGEILAAGGSDGVVRLWNVAANREIAQIVINDRSIRGGAVTGLSFSPDGRQLAVGATGKPGLSIADVKSGKVRTPFSCNAMSTDSISFSPDGKAIVGPMGLTVWSNTGEVKLIVKTQHARTVTFSKDGKTLAVAHDNQTVTVWDWEELLKLEPSPPPRFEIPDFLFPRTPPDFGPHPKRPYQPVEKRRLDL